MVMQSLPRPGEAFYISELILIEYPQDLVEGLVHLILSLLALDLVQRLGCAVGGGLRRLGRGGGVGRLLRLIEARGDDGDADLVVQRLVEGGAEDGQRIGMHRLLHQRGGLLHLLQSDVHGAGEARPAHR